VTNSLLLYIIIMYVHKRKREIIKRDLNGVRTLFLFLFSIFSAFEYLSSHEKLYNSLFNEFPYTITMVIFMKLFTWLD